MIKKILLFLFCTIVNSSRNIVLRKNNTVSLTTIVDDDSISKVIHHLYKMHKESHTNYENVYIYLDTPGGSVEEGNRLIETIEYLSNSMNISCIAHHVASMGFAILQACPHRLGLKTSSLMQHQMSTHLADEKQRLKTYMRYIDHLEEELISLQSNRIKMSNQQFKDLTYHNWWLTGKQGIKYNVLDELVIIGCDTSLLDTSITANASVFSDNIIITTNSNCPLIHKPIEIKYDSS